MSLDYKKKSCSVQNLSQVAGIHSVFFVYTCQVKIGGILKVLKVKYHTVDR